MPAGLAAASLVDETRNNTQIWHSPNVLLQLVAFDVQVEGRAQFPTMVVAVGVAKLRKDRCKRCPACVTYPTAVWCKEHGPGTLKTQKAHSSSNHIVQAGYQGCFHASQVKAY